MPIRQTFRSMKIHALQTKPSACFMLFREGVVKWKFTLRIPDAHIHAPFYQFKQSLFPTVVGADHGQRRFIAGFGIQTGPSIEASHQSFEVIFQTSIDRRIPDLHFTPIPLRLLALAHYHPPIQSSILPRNDWNPAMESPRFTAPEPRFLHDGRTRFLLFSL